MGCVLSQCDGRNIVTLGLNDEFFERARRTITPPAASPEVALRPTLGDRTNVRGITDPKGAAVSERDEQRLQQQIRLLEEEIEVLRTASGTLSVTWKRSRSSDADCTTRRAV